MLASFLFISKYVGRCINDEGILSIYHIDVQKEFAAIVVVNGEHKPFKVAFDAQDDVGVIVPVLCVSSSKRHRTRSCQQQQTKTPYVCFFNYLSLAALTPNTRVK